MRHLHPIPPLFDENSRVLILGSFPSVKSREGMFFYNHPQNRFWRVISTVLEVPEPLSVDEKRLMLLSNRIALWDVIESCEIEGSDDSSITDVVPNDLSKITSSAVIGNVFTNGTTAHRLYLRYGYAQTGLHAVKLPSTSPANAKFTLELLVKEWSIIKYALQK